MADQTKRQPVPAGGQPTPAAIASAKTTPPSTETAKAPEASSEEAGEDDLVDARVLVAFDGYEPDDIVSASAGEIEQFKLDGRADPHPDAVAYARELRA